MSWIFNAIFHADICPNGDLGAESWRNRSRGGDGHDDGGGGDGPSGNLALETILAMPSREGSRCTLCRQVYSDIEVHNPSQIMDDGDDGSNGRNKDGSDVSTNNRRALRSRTTLLPF